MTTYQSVHTRKGCKEAVFGIEMPAVRFAAFSSQSRRRIKVWRLNPVFFVVPGLGTNMPQPQSTIQSPRQHILPIRTKPNVPHGRIPIGINSLQTFTRRHIPDPDQTIVAPAHDATPIPAKIHPGHRITVRGDRGNAFPGSYIPELHRFIKTSRDEEIGLGIEADGEGEVGVGAEFDEGLGVFTGVLVCDVPEAEGFVVGGCGEVVGGAIEGHVVYSAGVAD
mmetsp:Transcript_46301/g.46768  ORF Transcript_46301/g.46768 Transcript_46301/m.46768 type:complete len:222 (+) Transcript_46301:245-910(+)